METKSRDKWVRNAHKKFSLQALLLSIILCVLVVTPLFSRIISHTSLLETLCASSVLPEVEFSYKPPPRAEYREIIWSTETDSRAVLSEPKHPVTLVTCYFLVSGAKHSSEAYARWMSNFLSPVQTPMVIFTTPELAPKIMKLRGKFAHLTELIVDFDVWTFPSVLEHAEAYRSTQYLKDPQQTLHIPELYAIWASKPWMVLEVSKRNPFGSKYFFWIDIGSFRSQDHSHRTWPHLERLETFWKGHESKVLVGLVKVPSYEKDVKWWLKVNRTTPPMKNLIVQGTFFGATASGIQWFSREFYRFRDKWMAKGVFVGDDQTIFTPVVALNWPHVFILDATTATCNVDPWFYFQHWLADNNESTSSCGRINLTLLEDEPLSYNEKPELLSAFIRGMGD